MTTEPQTEFDALETERLERRASVRRRIAELTLRAEKASELRRVIDSINAKSDEAANAHAAKCEPLQTELAALHEKQLDEITAKKTPAAADAKRRQELLTMVADANAELEKTVQANKSTIAKVEQQIRELQRTDGYNTIETLESQLCGAIATAQQQARAWMLQQKIRWTNARREAAHEKIGECKEALASTRYPDHIATYKRRLRQWECELSDAQQCFADARAESDALRRQCIDED